MEAGKCSGAWKPDDTRYGLYSNCSIIIGYVKTHPPRLFLYHTMREENMSLSKQLFQIYNNNDYGYEYTDQYNNK